MGLELYLDLLSQPCRAVFIFAKKNGIPFQLRTVQFLKGQNCSKEFLQINSLQKLPVLKDGDFILTESSAILIYLSCKYQVADHWYPSDLQTRSWIHEYLGWHADNIRNIFGVTLWIRIKPNLFHIRCLHHLLGPRCLRRRNATGPIWTMLCSNWSPSSWGISPSLWDSRC
uniref:glutathione transferase n=1 Tax=Marmota marmota marmota TaxID=9994 RepID=A0A8C5YIP0_MARMA